MTIVPFENTDPGDLPILRGAGRLERRQLTGEVRAAVIREQLAGALQALRLSNAYKLKNIQIDMHIELGERLASDMTATSNPLIKMALEDTWMDWIRTSNAIISLSVRGW